jgi:hypothetical protein
MDDGTKLRPWGAPPIKGLFAIAFETVIGAPPVRFVVTNIDFSNVIEFPNANQTYDLVFQHKVLVTFTPSNNAFKVSYESVGTADDGKIRGFLVIETSVGLCTPKTAVPEWQSVDTIDQGRERETFHKEEGHYLFTVMQTTGMISVTPPPHGITHPAGGGILG